MEYAALDAIAGREIFLELEGQGLLDLVGMEKQMVEYLMSQEEGDLKRAMALSLENQVLRTLFETMTRKKLCSGRQLRRLMRAEEMSLPPEDVKHGVVRMVVSEGGRVEEEEGERLLVPGDERHKEEA